MKSITKYQAMRKIVSAAKDIIGVSFYKTDGSSRIMAIRRKTMFGVKGDQASPTAQQARRTRRKNHPHLISVLEMRGGKPQWRTLNLATMYSIRVNGERFSVV